MKKRILALFLGGVMAAGSLAMQMPATAWAITMSECNDESAPHIKNLTVTAGDGQITMTVDMEFENIYSSNVIFYLLENELVKQKVSEYSDVLIYRIDSENIAGEYTFPLIEGGTHTFTGLTSGKTYYVYAEVNDWHNYEGEEAAHFKSYLGHITATAGSTLVSPTATLVPETSTATVPTPAPATDTVPTPVPVPETSTVTLPTPTPVKTDTASIKAVASEVLKGKWGVGKERKIRLEAAGYDYAAVQKMVARLMK